MCHWQQFYFVRLFFTNKWLAFFMLVFFVVNICANLVVPTQITPVYNWNLYSNPLPDSKHYTFNTVTYNNGEVLKFQRTWNEPQKVLIHNTMNLFIATQVDEKKDYSKKHFEESWLPRNKRFQKAFPQFINFPSHKEFEAFPSWYTRYLTQNTGEQIDRIQIIRKTVHFTESGHVREDSSEIVFNIP